MGWLMSSAVVAVRKAALLRLTGNLPGGEQVLDHMALFPATPYLAFERATVAQSRKLSGGGGSATLRFLKTIRLVFQAVTNPHALSTEKGLDDFIDEIDTLMAADLDLTPSSRRTVDQDFLDVEVFLRTEPGGAEFKRARLIWEVRVQ